MQRRTKLLTNKSNQIARVGEVTHLDHARRQITTKHDQTLHTQINIALDHGFDVFFRRTDTRNMRRRIRTRRDHAFHSVISTILRATTRTKRHRKESRIKFG